MIPKSGYRFSEEIMPPQRSVIPESGNRFSEKITRKRGLERDDESTIPLQTMNEEVLS
jgi:hypothetical protein